MSVEHLEAAKDTVTKALDAPTFARFTELLQEAGYGFAVRRCSPILLPKDRCGIRLVRIDLCRWFWLRFACWSDGLGPWLEKRGPSGLCTWWRGVTGEALTRRPRRRVVSLVGLHGLAPVAERMRCVLDEIWRHHGRPEFSEVVRLCEALTPRCSTWAWRPAPEPRFVKTNRTPLPSDPYGGSSQDSVEAAQPAIADGPTPIPDLHPDLATAVARALRETWQWQFKLSMGAQGYRVQVRGSDCVLEPYKEGSATPLAELGLNREYWLRACEWLDGLAAARWETPLQELSDVWTGLFGAPADVEVLRGIGEALKVLPPLVVAHAAYTTCWRKSHLDADQRLRYFWGVWLREAKRRRFGQEPVVQRAGDSLPRDMRPEYRGTCRRYRRRISLPQSAAQPGVDLQGLGQVPA